MRRRALDAASPPFAAPPRFRHAFYAAMLMRAQYGVY